MEIQPLNQLKPLSTGGSADPDFAENQKAAKEAHCGVGFLKERGTHIGFHIKKGGRVTAQPWVKWTPDH